MANKSQQTQDSIARYYTALASGVPRQKAFADAFPQGLPTRQELAADNASNAQKAQIGQIGGMLAGVLGSKAIYNGIVHDSVWGKGGTPQWIDKLFGSGGTNPAPASGASLGSSYTAPNTTAGFANYGESLGLAPTGGEIGASYGGLPAPTGAEAGVSQAGQAASAGGTPYFEVGAPSYAGYAAGAIRAGTGAYNYFNSDAYEKDKNQQATWDATMAGLDVATGGLAELGDLALKKGLGDEKYGKFQKYYVEQVPLYHIMNALGSGKSEQQYMRDQWRKEAQDRGWLSPEEEMYGTLADGTQFAFGKNTSFNTGKFDEDDSVSRNVAGLGDVIASAQGLTGKARESVATLLTNAARSNANGDLGIAQQNMKHFAEQYGLNPQTIQQNLDALHQEGKIDDSQHSAWAGQIGLLFNPTGKPFPPYEQGQILAGALK